MLEERGKKVHSHFHTSQKRWKAMISNCDETFRIYLEKGVILVSFAPISVDRQYPSPSHCQFLNVRISGIVSSLKLFWPRNFALEPMSHHIYQFLDFFMVFSTQIPFLSAI